MSAAARRRSALLGWRRCPRDQKRNTSGEKRPGEISLQLHQSKRPGMAERKVLMHKTMVLGVLRLG